jgi:hypothetical protein
VIFGDTASGNPKQMRFGELDFPIGSSDSQQVSGVSSTPSPSNGNASDLLLPFSGSRVPSSLLSPVDRSDMTLDVPCPGLLRLLVAVHSLRGENPTFAILELFVSALFKGIHVACLRFLRQLLVMNILRSRLDNMVVFHKIQSLVNVTARSVELVGSLPIKLPVVAGRRFPYTNRDASELCNCAQLVRRLKGENIQIDSTESSKTRSKSDDR